MVLAFNHECLLLVAFVLLLQHKETLQLAGMDALVLVVNYPIATHMLLPEVLLHRTKCVAMCKIFRCKALYCYTLVVVVIGQAPLLPLKFLVAICGSLCYHEVDFGAIGGVLYCH